MWEQGNQGGDIETAPRVAADGGAFSVARIFAQLSAAGVRVKVRSEAEIDVAGSSSTCKAIIDDRRFDLARTREYRRQGAFPILAIYNVHGRYPWVHFSASAIEAAEHSPALVRQIVYSALTVWEDMMARV